MRVLLAEDDLGTRRRLARALRKWGYEVIEADNGLEAWRIMQDAAAPRLVILDWMMQGMDGVEVCKKIRSRGASDSVYVLFLTAKDQQADVRQCLEAGVDDYIIKPCDLAELRGRLLVRGDMSQIQQRAADAPLSETNNARTKWMQERTAELVVTNTSLKREIAERKRLEEALNRSEAHFRTAFTFAPIGMALVDVDGQFLQVNQALCEIVGYSEHELLATTFQTFTHPDDLPGDLDNLQRLLAGQVLVYEREKRYVHKNGAIVWGLVNVSLARDAQQQPLYFIAQIQDITARKRAEEALQQEREVTSAILDNASALVVVFDLEGRVVRFNQACENVSGYAIWEATGAPVWDLLLLPDEVTTFRDVFVKVQQHASPQLHEHVWRTKNGASRQVMWSYSPLRSQNGAVEYVIGFGVDVTEQRRLETQLALTRKMESIGQLAAGIAHEINTPLQYIGDNSRFLQDAFQDLHTLLIGHERLLAATKAEAVTAALLSEVEASAKTADYAYLSAEIPQAIEQSLQGITHVATIVRAMKEFSHPSAAEKCASDLNRAIETTITMSRNEWKYVAEMTTDFDLTLPPVPCLRGEFNQAILNLILNAAHAIGDVVGDGGKGKGAISISTRREGNWVEIRIRDTGMGIPEEIKGRIFDPFFTTKDVSKGTGQGLAMVHAIVVKKHQGSITFESELGKGTTFIVRLPLQSSALQQKDSYETAHSLCG